MHYIYHIPGVKIGCTKDIATRMRKQGFSDWEILEQHVDPQVAGDREWELQDQYGFPRDAVHYTQLLEMSVKGGEASKNHLINLNIQYSKERRAYSYEFANHIKNLVDNGKSITALAKELNIPKTSVRRMAKNTHIYK